MAACRRRQEADLQARLEVAERALLEAARGLRAIKEAAGVASRVTP
jgi:hypothetical protein